MPPGETQAPPPRPAHQQPDVPAPGEVACPRCGAGNSADRHFCRRCALELRGTAPREVPPPPPPPRRTPSPAVWVLIGLAALALLLLLGPQVLAALSASGPATGAAAAACWAAPGHTGSEASPRERSMSQ